MFHAREYVRAGSLEEAYQLNQKKSGVLVGGMMWLKMAKLNKGTIIDLSGLGLDRIEEDEDGFHIGCMCTLRQLELHQGLNRYFHNLFKECTRHIVGVQFRNTATVGGSIFGRFGFSDILTCMLALDTTVEFYQSGTVALADFAGNGAGRDVLVQIHIKKDGRIPAYVSQRNSKSDLPVINCCLARDQEVCHISVGARPERAKVVTVRADQMTGEHLKEVIGQFGFHDNMRAGGEYRRHLAEVYVRRLYTQTEVIGNGEGA